MSPFSSPSGWGGQPLTASSLRCVMPQSDTTMVRLSYLPLGLAGIQGEVEPAPCSWRHRQETRPHQMSQTIGECLLQLQGVPLPCPATSRLLALLDANGKFIWFDNPALGCSSDTQIFLYSDLR